ncbi:universal stress protein [Amycolatopsis sp. FDAARGOS 1241]|uniref:universal stress protein n=1 Tax=Amycolatopsis sp. FDAARGOS 1241 TaxID=2778070 RepID=UPI001EF1FF73|nr:universal stress protein [Amycolatopsis sp. FDAARGOS 1241]
MTGTAARAGVVAGVDESEAALVAVRWAAEEATRRGCVLQLFHAGLSDTAGLTGPERSREAPRLLERAHRWIRRAAQVAEEAAPGVRTEYLVRLGLAADLLVELSADADLIVLGSHGLGGLHGAAIGSVALRVAAGAHCPVVVVRGRAKPGGPVLTGVDRDDGALEFAFEAALDRGVPVVAVHAWHEGLLDAPEIVEAEAQCEEEELHRRVEALSGKYPEVRARSCAVRDRSPARALLRFDGAQLVVIGSRGRGPITGALFGSTGNRLLAESACPVAVVH